ncbi:hypothetical protein AURDEDRAFT_112102 [Auricularia subglabra TFB-10046 SS5]|nr:hypothetical protein AURDEDRAFT_112102 [Auricularia subglabra TFB-10046 SS5]
MRAFSLVFALEPGLGRSAIGMRFKFPLALSTSQTSAQTCRALSWSVAWCSCAQV